MENDVAQFPLILKRVESDVASGKHWLARRRLESHLQSKGFNDYVVRKLAEICWEMHDAESAGRFWIVTSADDARSRQAIGEFTAACGQNPRQIFASLPRFARLKDLSLYPPAAQRRLDALGISPLLKKTPMPPAYRQAFNRYLMLGFLLVMLGVWLTGAAMIVHWLRTWLF